MTAHKHARIIKAKADNMELVVFVKYNEEWQEVSRTDGDACAFYSDCEYFLCLPKHKEACLHWLNGGVIWDESTSWLMDKLGMENVEWFELSIFMSDKRNLGIKPRKQKRWIAACNSGYNCIDKLFDSKNQAKEFVTAFYPNNRVDDFQLIEIEVEI